MKTVCRFCGEKVEHPCRREGTPAECRYTNPDAHRQEPKPHNRRDAEWAVIARAAELADYVRCNGMKHVTEVRLIEAIDDFHSFPVVLPKTDMGSLR